MPVVAVVLSTYQHSRYLEDQNTSILGQQGVEVRLYVRDDGSTNPEMFSLLKNLESNARITLMTGKHVGVAHSFWTLLEIAFSNLDNEYFAFSDQDDLWDLSKLSKQIEGLTKFRNTPTLSYTGSTMIGLKFRQSDLKSLNVELKISEVLLEGRIRGNTMLLNRRGCIELLRNKPKAHFRHDVWATLIILTFGKILCLPESLVRYRIHEDNTVGVQGWIGILKDPYRAIQNLNLLVEQSHFFYLSKKMRYRRK